MILNLEEPTGDGPVNSVSSTFHGVKVTRTLMSVGHICDQGLHVVFDKTKAVVTNKEGAEICVFHRCDSGLYISKMKLKRPLPFGGPGS